MTTKAKVRRRAASGALVYAHSAALLLLAPFVVFLAANDYALFSDEVLLLYLFALMVGLAIAALVQLQMKVLAQLALWGCVFLAVAFLYDVNSKLQVTAVVVFSGVAIWLLRANAALVLLIVAAVHIGSTLGLHYLDNAIIVKRDSLGNSAPVAGAADLPPVVHLVFDEFVGLRGLPSELPGSQQLLLKLAKYYPAHGFYLSSHAYSQYFNTRDSLANLVNFKSSATRGAYVSGTAGAFVIDTNMYFEHLSNLGYAHYIYQSSYLNFCVTPAVTVTSCLSYKNNSIASIADIDIPTAQKSQFIFNSFVNSAIFARKVQYVYSNVGDMLGIKLPAWPTEHSRIGPLAAMTTIADLKSALRELGPGEFHFAHLMLPHYPYNLNADCSVKPQVRNWLNRVTVLNSSMLGERNSAAARAKRYSQYLVQVECTQKIIEELFAAIQASGQWQRSIIIIHGDHGSRITRHDPLVRDPNLMVADDFRDAYSTFFAVKYGTAIGGLDASPLPLQTLLARVWNLPAPQLQSQQVYLRVPDQEYLQATPLLGFDDPILGIRIDH